MGTVFGALVVGIGLSIVLTLLIERCQYINCSSFFLIKTIYVRFLFLQLYRTRPQ
jgi:hypothetical protein